MNCNSLWTLRRQSRQDIACSPRITAAAGTKLARNLNQVQSNRFSLITELYTGPFGNLRQITPSVLLRSRVSKQLSNIPQLLPRTNAYSIICSPINSLGIISVPVWPLHPLRMAKCRSLVSVYPTTSIDLYRHLIRQMSKYSLICLDLLQNNTALFYT